MASKAAKLTSKALAKAKKALRKFKGELASPILVPGPEAEWGPLSPTSLEREIAQQRRAKLPLLYALYRIQPSDKDRIPKLAECLLADLVPGMITIEQRPSPYKEGLHKNKSWTIKQCDDPVRAVDANREKYRKGKIIAAIYDLVEQQPKKWGQYKGRERSLETRYHEAKKILANLKVPIGLWKPSQL